MTSSLWIHPLSLTLGFLVGVLVSQLFSWRRVRLADERQERLRDAESRVDAASVALQARKAALERAMNEHQQQKVALEEMERVITPKMEELKQWWTEARVWEAAVAIREEEIEGREAAASAEVERSRAALKGARARAKRLQSRYRRQPGR